MVWVYIVLRRIWRWRKIVFHLGAEGDDSSRVDAEASEIEEEIARSSFVSGEENNIYRDCGQVCQQVMSWINVGGYPVKKSARQEESPSVLKQGAGKHDRVAFAVAGLIADGVREMSVISNKVRRAWSTHIYVHLVASAFQW